MIVDAHLDVIVVSDSALYFDAAMAGFSGIMVLVALRLALRRSSWLRSVCRSQSALWVVSDWIKANAGKGTQSYSEGTGLLTKLVDSSHKGMEFTATYDFDGNILTECYPNSMNATCACDALGTSVALEYRPSQRVRPAFRMSVRSSKPTPWLRRSSKKSKQESASRDSLVVGAVVYRCIHRCGVSLSWRGSHNNGVADQLAEVATARHIEEEQREAAEEATARSAAAAAAQAAQAAAAAQFASTEAPWEQAYAMGGPSLSETIAATGITEGGGMEGEGGGGGSGFIIYGGRGPGEKCGAMYENKPCHHGGGGQGGTPEAKKKCPPNYSEIPLVHLCISFEWPSGPSPAPSYGPYPEPVPVGP